MKKEYKEVLHVLTELNKDFPSYGVARHIATATADYGDIWSMTDKELLFALVKYQAELELDNNQLVSDEYVRQIQEDAKHLFDPINEDEEDY